MNSLSKRLTTIHVHPSNIKIRKRLTPRQTSKKYFKYIILILYRFKTSILKIKYYFLIHKENAYFFYFKLNLYTSFLICFFLLNR